MFVEKLPKQGVLKKRKYFKPKISVHDAKEVKQAWLIKVLKEFTLKPH